MSSPRSIQDGAFSRAADQRPGHRWLALHKGGDAFLAVRRLRPPPSLFQSTVAVRPASGKEQAMRSYPGDLTPVVLALAGALVFVVVISRLFSWYRWRALRLCLLTGTRPQRAALVVALAPVVREFLPLLDRAGQQVRAIVLVPTLSGSEGEPLVAEVEQLSGSNSFIVRLAHRLGGAVRQPDEVAGVLAEDLL